MSLIPILEQPIIDEFLPKEFPHLYASSASSKPSPTGPTLGACNRKEWFRLNNIPPSDKGTLRRNIIFSCGNSIEDEVIAQFKRQQSAFIADHIKMFDYKSKWSCEIDLLALDSNSIPSIVEIKSFAGYYNKKTLTGKDGSPKEANIMQIALYLYLKDIAEILPRKTEPQYSITSVKEVLRTQVNHGYLIYINREAPEELIEFKVTLSKGRISYKNMEGRSFSFGDIGDILSRGEGLLKFYSEKIPPPRDFFGQYSKEDLSTRYDNDKMNKAEKAIYENKGWVSSGDWQCRYHKNRETGAHEYLYCPYGNLCESVDNETFILEDNVLPFIPKLNEGKDNIIEIENE